MKLLSMRMALAGLAMVPGLARAAEAPCLAAAEFGALASYALPSIVSGVSQRCSATLPAGAFLPSEGAELVRRYALAKPAAWPMAKGALLRLVGDARNGAASILAAMPDPQLQQFADAAIVAKVGESLPTDRCPGVDRLLRLISPLPSETTAEIVVLAVGLGAVAGPGRWGRIAACPA